MATKKCPYCGEEIDSEALKCRYCNEWLTRVSNEETIDRGETDLRNAVGRILVEDKDYLAAVRYYASVMGCNEKEARKYVDNLNAIIRDWSEKGGLSFKCPHCGSSLRIGQTQCEVCGSIVCADIPTSKKLVQYRTSWWSRNKGWVILLIIVHIMVNILVLLMDC